MHYVLQLCSGCAIPHGSGFWEYRSLNSTVKLRCHSMISWLHTENACIGINIVWDRLFASETNMISFSGALLKSPPLWCDGKTAQYQWCMICWDSNPGTYSNCAMGGCLGTPMLSFFALGVKIWQPFWVLAVFHGSIFVVGGNVLKTSDLFQVRWITWTLLFPSQVQKVCESNVPCNGGQGHWWGDLSLNWEAMQRFEYANKWFFDVGHVVSKRLSAVLNHASCWCKIR